MPLQQCSIVARAKLNQQESRKVRWGILLPTCLRKGLTVAVILVVDDDLAVADFVCRALEKHGHQTRAAFSFNGAVTAARRVNPALVILDLKLPDGDGLDLFGALRRDVSDLTGIVITGFGTPTNAHACGRAGILAYLEKPVKMEELVRAVEIALDHGDRHPSDPTGVSVANRPASPRATRIVDVLIGLLTVPTDVHSIEGLCRVARVGVAAPTFRRWCKDEGLSPGHALAFARLLRALECVRKHGASPNEWIDVDQRTFRSLLRRGNITELFERRVPTLREFVDRQAFVENPVVLDLVRRACLGPQD